MNTANVRLLVPGLLLVSVGLAWLVMPSVDTGPDIGALQVPDVVKAPPRPEEAPVARDNQQMPALPAKPPPPAVPREAREPAARVARPMAMVQPDALRGGVVGRGRDVDMMSKRAQRVAQRFHDAGFKARDLMGWDDRTYQDVTKRLDEAEGQLELVRQELDDGTIDTREASERILGVQESTMEDVAGLLDDESARLMRRQLGMVVADIEAEQAWEGIPFEEWAADMEANGDWGDWSK